MERDISYPASDLENFCTSGVYIPFCITPDNIVVLIVNNRLVRGALYERENESSVSWTEEKTELIDRLKDRLKTELNASERTRDHWINMTWTKSRQKRNGKNVRNSVSLFNLTRGNVLHVTDGNDRREIERHLKRLHDSQRASEDLKRRLQSVISFTKFLRDLYNKYDERW